MPAQWSEGRPLTHSWTSTHCFHFSRGHASSGSNRICSVNPTISFVDCRDIASPHCNRALILTYLKIKKVHNTKNLLLVFFNSQMNKLTDKDSMLVILKCRNMSSKLSISKQRSFYNLPTGKHSSCL